MEEIEKRKEKVLELAKKYKNYIIYIALAALSWFAFKIRTSNLPILNGQLADPDAHLFYRYAEYILEHGKLFANDPLRYYPIGYNTGGENVFVSYFIVWLYKFLNFFNPSLTLKQIDIIYPAIVFIPALIFFYLLVKRLFDWRVGLAASAFLTVLPAFLFRTMSGVSDKEGLAILFLFITLYLYVVAWQSKNIKRAVLFGGLAGVSTVLLGLSWGGVQFVFLMVALFNLIELFLNKFEEKDFFIYIIWYLITIIGLLIFSPGRYTLTAFLTSPILAITSFVFLVVIIDYIITKYNPLNLKHKFDNKIPHRIVSMILSFIFSIVFAIMYHGPKYFISVIKEVSDNMLAPFGQTRWALTVAESKQPFFVDWLGDFGWIFFLFFIVSSILLFYELVKPIKERKYHLTILFSFMIFGVIFSRYSPGSILNGSSNISRYLYFGSILFFIIGLIYFYFSIYKKDKTVFKEIMLINKRNTFLLIWLFISLIAARGAIRLVFVLTPIIAALVPHFLFYIADHSKNFKKKSYTTLIYIAVIIILIFMFSGFAKSTMTRSKYVGPLYDPQWQEAEQWVKQNTNEDDVFVHWWDYGYLVQTGFNRATVTDGGNSAGSWNYFVGRHVLTGQNETELLEFMKAHNASYFLAVSEDIGKYSAYSSIGSDVDYDRFSWISVFGIDLSQTQETRDQTIYIYKGGFGFDEDFIYNGEVFGRNSAGIGGFFIPIKQEDNRFSFGQPIAIVINNGKRYDLPLSCVAYGNTINEFESYVLDGCLKIMPYVNNEVDQIPIGAALYLSPRVKRTMFAQLYILGKEFDNIKLAFSTSPYDVAVYQGRVIGPLKIWKTTYDESINDISMYRGFKLPDPRVEIPTTGM